VLAGRVVAHAHRRLRAPSPLVASAATSAASPAAVAGAPPRTVASFDCYHEPPGLALRDAVPGAALFTFTGGSGGAAKTVLATSRAAAGVLLGLHAGYPARGG
jgi:hypothetical protein